MTRRSTGSIALCLTALAALTLADLTTKHWARGALSKPKAAALTPPLCAPDSEGRRGMQRAPVHSTVLIEGHLQLRYAENCGAAFGMLGTAPPALRTGLFTLSALGFTALLLVLYVRGGGGRMFAIAVPLIASGALGNLVDRLHAGYVVDFIRYHGLFEWPTFNVADITIAVGAALLILDGFGVRQRQTAVDPAPEAATP
jgi:signal peptidase II